MAQLSFMRYLSSIYKLNLEASNIVHNAIIKAIHDSFIMVKGDIDQMRLELCITTASGQWLDYWGDYFLVPRRLGESDEDYSKRIIFNVTRPKVTIPAMKSRILEYINSEYGTEYDEDDIQINEPWKWIARYSDKGELSNDAWFCSSGRYTHALIEIAVPENVSTELRDLANAIKSAGVKVVWNIVNTYDDVISDIDKQLNTYAGYHKQIITMVSPMSLNGLIMSESTRDRTLSGNQNMWIDYSSNYHWYCKYVKNTDESVILKPLDLMGLLYYFTHVEIDEGQPVEVQVKVTEELLKMFKTLDIISQIIIKYNKRWFPDENGDIGITHDVKDQMWEELLDALNTFKEINREYYDSVEPPIIVGELARQYTFRHENWIGTNICLTLEDLYNTAPITPTSEVGGDSLKLESLIEYEDTYYRHCVASGTRLLSPIVFVGGDEPTERKIELAPPRILGTPLWSSRLFGSDDIIAIYERRNLSSMTVSGVIDKENSYYDGYSRVGYDSNNNTQPRIIVTQESI